MTNILTETCIYNLFSKSYWDKQNLKSIYFSCKLLQLSIGKQTLKHAVGVIRNEGKYVHLKIVYGNINALMQISEYFLPM